MNLFHAQVIRVPIASPAVTAPAIITCCFRIGMVKSSFFVDWQVGCDDDISAGPGNVNAFGKKVGGSFLRFPGVLVHQ